MRQSTPGTHHIPIALTSFIGRQTQIAELGRLASQGRLLTLTGAGGCGKTRLAAEVARLRASEHADGVWWVDLAPVNDPAAVAQTVAAALGLRDSLTDTREQLTGYVQGRDMLLVLDNCEHLLDATADLIHALLTDGPKVAALATSREPLGVAGERIWRVPSLSVPEPGMTVSVPPSPDEHEATRLFYERATRVRPDLQLDAAGTAAVGMICRRLDGMPLAIELAAARVRNMGVAEIAAGLGDRFRVLTGGPRTAPARQQTLLASVAWSHDLLSPAEQIVLRRLAVFAGGFTSGACAGVCSGSGIEDGQARELLAQLIDKSLVVMHLDRPVTRYRLLETVRQFATDRLQEAGEDAAVRTRHMDFFRDLAVGAEPAVESADPGCLDALEADHDNLRAAADWAQVTDPTSALELARSLTLFWYQRAFFREGRRRLTEALATTPDATRAAGAWWALGHLTFYQGDVLTALGNAQQAMQRAEESDDEAVRARALGLIAWIQMWVDPAAAQVLVDTAVPLARAAGDLWCLADCLQAASWTHLVREDYDLAQSFAEEAAAVANRLGNPYFLAWNGGAFGYMQLRTGEFAAAGAALESGLAASRAVGEPNTLGWNLVCLAELTAAVGDYEGALEALDDPGLRRLEETMGGPSVVWVWLAAQTAQPLLALGRVDDARAKLNASVEAMRVQGVEWSVMLSLATLAGLEADEARPGAARACAEEVRTIASRLGNERAVAEAVHVLGRVALAEQDWARAEGLYHDALAIRAARGFRPALVESFEAVAELAASVESWTEAARVLGAAERLRTELGLARWPSRRARYDDLVSRIRTSLGEPEFDRVQQEGAALSSEEAVAYLRRARGERKRPATGWAALTPTELRVTELVAEGLTNPQIAARLFMSLGTVKTHLTHVFTKLAVATRAEVVAQAIRMRDRIP